MNSPDQWLLIHPLMTEARMQRECKHWDNASALALQIDAVAGSNEAAAGAFYSVLIRDAPPEARPIILRLVCDADALRGSARTRH